ncbi:MAG: DedA family protein [Legionellales bacterium]|nr:DedA family protein [Legionellales bacterium]
MTFILNCIQFIAHLDIHLQQLVLNYGIWVYLILFLIIFIETGLVVAPFLPGDSLLFAAGSLAAVGGLNPHLLVLLLFIAAVLGDNLNYFIGRFVGLRLFQRPDSRWFKRAYLERSHQFYEEQGHKAIIIARFIPIIRTFMPFTAGLSRMTYRRFLGFDLMGGALWVGGIVYASYLFGNIPIIKNNFSLIVFAIIVISLLPVIWEIAMTQVKRV